MDKKETKIENWVNEKGMSVRDIAFLSLSIVSLSLSKNHLKAVHSIEMKKLGKMSVALHFFLTCLLLSASGQKIVIKSKSAYNTYDTNYAGRIRSVLRTNTTAPIGKLIHIFKSVYCI